MRQLSLGAGVRETHVVSAVVTESMWDTPVAATTGRRAAEPVEPGWRTGQTGAGRAVALALVMTVTFVDAAGAVDPPAPVWHAAARVATGLVAAGGHAHSSINRPGRVTTCEYEAAWAPTGP